MDASYQAIKDNRNHFARFKGRLLSLKIEDDVFIGHQGIERVHHLFINSAKFIRPVAPEYADALRLGFFGFFKPHTDALLWNMALSYIRDNYVDSPRAVAEFDDTHFPMVIIRILSPDADSEMAIAYFENMRKYLEKGDVYFVLDLTYVHWAGEMVRKAAPKFVHENAQLIRTRHKGTAYVAPNFFVRNFITIFHKIQTDNIIQPVVVFKNMESAVNWVNHRITCDSLKS